MWSIGVLLYIMLSGRHPFDRPPSSGAADADEAQAETLERILHGRYAFDASAWSGISGRARQLVTQVSVELAPRDHHVTTM